MGEWVRDTSGTALKTQDAMLDYISTILLERRIMATVSTVICCDVCDTPAIRIPGEFEHIDPAGEIRARCSEHV